MTLRPGSLWLTQYFTLYNVHHSKDGERGAPFHSSPPRVSPASRFTFSSSSLRWVLFHLSRPLQVFSLASPSCCERWLGVSRRRVLGNIKTKLARRRADWSAEHTRGFGTVGFTRRGFEAAERPDWGGFVQMWCLCCLDNYAFSQLATTPAGEIDRVEGETQDFWNCWRLHFFTWKRLDYGVMCKDMALVTAQRAEEAEVNTTWKNVKTMTYKNIWWYISDFTGKVY